MKLKVVLIAFLNVELCNTLWNKAALCWGPYLGGSPRLSPREHLEGWGWGGGGGRLDGPTPGAPVFGRQAQQCWVEVVLQKECSCYPECQEHAWQGAVEGQ